MFLFLSPQNMLDAEYWNAEKEAFKYSNSSGFLVGFAHVFLLSWKEKNTLKGFCHKEIILSMLLISKSWAENSSTVYRNSFSVKRYLHFKYVLRFLLDNHFVYLHTVLTFVFYCVCYS